jgi:hypothetical protein
MAEAMKTVLATLGAGALLVGAAVTSGHRTFKRDVDREVRELFARVKDVAPSVVAGEDLAGLPDPVQRWLRSARVVGTPRPVTVRLRQAGRFRLDERLGWLPLRAEQYYTTNPPGFIWFADIGWANLLTITGRDRYECGRGAMDIRLLSLFPVVHAAGPELDQGALLRFLSETVWFPAAVLNPYITWEGIDARSARATMHYEGVTASATFYFSEQGDPTNVVAERYRFVGGCFVLDTWSTPVTTYGELAGIRTGVEGEAVWKLPSGDLPYIRLRITDLEYNRAELY